MNFTKKDLPNLTRTKRWIISALFRLMETDEYKKITITQIIDEAEIARRTFYVHYKNKHQIIKEYIDETFSRIWLEFNQAKQKSLYDIAYYSFSECFKHIEILRVLHKHNLSNYFYEQFIIKMNKTTKESNLAVFDVSDFSESEMIYLNIFHASGLVKMIDRWIQDGCEDTPEKMAALYVKICKIGILND